MALLFAVMPFMTGSTAFCGTMSPSDRCCCSSAPEPSSCCDVENEKPAVPSESHRCECAIEQPDTPFNQAKEINIPTRIKSSFSALATEVTRNFISQKIVKTFNSDLCLGSSPPGLPPLYILDCSLLR